MFIRFLLLITLCLIGCQCTKKSSFATEVSERIDSLCMYKAFQSKELFIIQHEEKQNKNYIRISTSEYFDKDSTRLILEHKNKLIVYYYTPFSPTKKDSVKMNSYLSKYGNRIYQDNTISIFRPNYIIFELTNEGKLKNIPKDKYRNLFLYGSAKQIQEL